MSYSASNLNLSIMTIADDAINRLDLLAERLSVIEGSLKHISGMAKSTTRSGGGRKSTTDNISKGLLNIGKWTMVVASARRLGRFMGTVVQAGSDYNETLNLWQVSMRNNLDMADKFVNKMQRAYGISSTTTMNAQAIFKNMIGSLGQITDQTAYKLSEALVQMSADFSSLYNVPLKSAFDKMQSMLAGQVRPIRSAGLDMTETTLFMFYQQLGGTKTMRQLNRTEKQLLSILAVYQQMGSAGALGDMTKTLNQFANQSRMMTEYWKELKTWSGLLLKDLIDQSGLLIYINAGLITITEIIKAIAKSRGLGEENFIDGILETTNATNDAVDELQGKLLDFDKFRTFEGISASPLAIDEKLLEAIAGYSSKIDEAQNKAQKLAEVWTKFWLTDEGELTEDAEELLGVIDGLLKFGTILVGLKLGAWLLGTAKALVSLSVASKDLNSVLLAGIVYAFLEAVEAFEKGDKVAGILAVSVGVVLVGALVLAKISQNKLALATALATVGVEKQNSVMLISAVATNKAAIAYGALALGMASLSAGISMYIYNFDKLGNKAKWLIPIIATLAGVVTALVAALTIMKGNWVGALGLGATVTGIGLMVGTQLSIPNYEMGASDIDSGTVFRAGEFGKTEAVYTGSNGKTNVANVKQMKMAFLGALNDWTAQYLDGELDDIVGAVAGATPTSMLMYSAVKSEAKKRGETFVSI